MTHSEIEIQASPSGDRCKFAVDRPVSAKAVAFPTRESAGGSPLAEALFALEGVSSLTIAGHTVVVTKSGPGDWPPLARQIGAAIRAQLLSGIPAVSEAASASASQEELRARIQKILDSQINPAIAAHGGSVELLDVREGVVFVQMSGGCQGCGSANATLKHGIEGILREEIPEIVEVLDTTDHAAGRNPYYASAG
jgi:Fe-S cluster biogenesis protein NfuA